MNEIERAIAYLKDAAKIAAKNNFKKEVFEETKNIINTAITALELQLNGGWIPVSERLPKEGIAVLVSDKQGNVCVRAITCEIKGRKYWSQDKYDVLVWQPLPEKYKEVENE